MRDQNQSDKNNQDHLIESKNGSNSQLKQPIPTQDGPTRFQTGRLKGLTMNKAMFILAWPVVIESFLNSLVGIVDTKLSASLPNGVEATDAIGGASYFMWLIGLVIMAIGVGATALIARSIGKGRIGVANTVLGQTFTLALISGFTIGFLLWLIAPQFADMLFITPELKQELEVNPNSSLAAQYFTDYLRIIAYGVPGSAILFAMISCSRGAGDSRSPLKAMIARNIVNIIVSWALSGVTLFGLTCPIEFNMGIQGIAAGTVAGDFVGAMFILKMAMGGRWSIKLKFRRMKFHKITTSRLVKLGIPNFFETFGLWVGNFFIVAFVSLLDTQTNTSGLLGAHIIAIRIEAFSFMPGFGMGIAASTLAGQYLGMKRADLAQIAVYRCTIIASVIMGILGTLFILFPNQITASLSSQEAHLELVPPLLITCGIVQVPFAIGIVLRSAMRGAGDVKWVLGLTWFATYAIRLPLAYIVSGVDIPIPDLFGGGMIINPKLTDRWFGIEPGLTALWIALCTEMFIRGGIFATRFFFGGWRNAQV